MTDSNTGGEATILEERRRKLEELRAENKAYINDFIPSEHALDLHELLSLIHISEPTRPY